MKKILLIIVAVFLLTGAYAQSNSPAAGPKLSVGLDFGLPLGDLGRIYTIGFGGSGKAELPLSSNLNFTFTAGYITYYYESPIKKILEAYKSDTYAGFVPVKAGGKYFFSKNVYGEAEIGALIGTNNNSGTSFIYAPGLGVSYPVSAKHDIDFGARYEGWSKDGGNVGQVAFRIAYKFGL